MRCSAGNTIITPHHPAELGGTAGHPPWRTIDGDLEANLAILWNDGDTRPTAVLVSVDLLYGSASLQAEIANASGVPIESVLIFASHTHQAPMIDTSKPRLGRPQAGYSKLVSGQICALVQELIDAGGEQVSVHHAVGEADHSVNRRGLQRARRGLGRSPRDSYYGPDVDGCRDETISVLVLRDSSGTDVLVLWNYACHPVAYPDKHAVSPHFPGECRNMLRSTPHNTSLPVIFAQGFSGNTRPNCTVASPKARWFAQSDKQRVFVAIGRGEYKAWASQLGARLLDVYSQVATVHNVPLIFRHGACASEVLYKSESEIDPLQVFSLKLAPGVTLVGANVEIVAEYAVILRRAHPEESLFLAGCVGQVLGYVPTGEMLCQGGYEASGFLKFFSLAEVDSGIQDSFWRTLESVLE